MIRPNTLPEAFYAVLESLHAGIPMVRAAKAAGSTEAAIRAHAAGDKQRAEALDAAEDLLERRAAKGTAKAPPMPATVSPVVTWADVAEASPEPAAALVARAAAMPGWTPWDRARIESGALGQGLYGMIQWVNRRCERDGLHAMDPWWLNHFRKFYASSKMVDAGRAGLRAAKSDSVCRALVPEAIMALRTIEPGQVGVIPIMSAGVKEATDRCDTIAANLRALGLEDRSGSRSKGTAGAFRTLSGEAGGKVIETVDSQDHPIEFRVYPASKAGAVGYTAVAGFCDEVDLWRDKETGANQASAILDLLFFRFTTQREAKLHIWSAAYGGESAHRKRIELGDTPLQHVARLGTRGATKDASERWRLVARAGPDPRLLEAADPRAVNIPAWVSNPIVPIDRCYDLAEGDLTRMFAFYGGRPADEQTGADTDFDVLGEPSRYADETASEREYR